jgi:hypothetical protein
MRELTKENIIEDAKRVMRDIPELFSEDAILAFDDLDIEIIEHRHAHEVRVSSKKWTVVSIALTMPIIIALIKYYPKHTKLTTPYLMSMKAAWTEVDVLSDKRFRGETVFFMSIAVKNADEDILKYIAEKGSEKYIQDTLRLCDVYNCIESKALLLKYIKRDDTSEDMML